MAPEIHVNATDELQTVVEQEEPPVEMLPTPTSGAIESRQEVTPSGVALTAPPTPPSGRLAAIIQQMPPVWRWVLGLGLAFLSSFAFVLLSDIHPVAKTIVLVVTFGLALAAGFVLSSWWALLALAVVTAARRLDRDLGARADVTCRSGRSRTLVCLFCRANTGAAHLILAGWGRPWQTARDSPGAATRTLRR